MKRLSFIVVLATVLPLVVVAVSLAQTINACYHIKDGTLRIVGDPTDCAKNEQFISWSQLGHLPTPVMWSGGCAHDGVDYGNFNPYCADAVEFNTASSHLNVDGTTGVFTVLIPGYYRINIWAVSGGNAGNGLCHLVIKKNGSNVYFGHDGCHDYTNSRADITLPFNTNDTFNVEIYNQGVAFYTWTGGLLNRMQVSFVGDLQP